MSGSRSETDDLTAIPGLGPALAKKSSQAGILSYAQLAALSNEAIVRLERNVIKYAGRIKRHDWVRKARERLHA